MITIQLMGGLGNQLFQIATTLAFAIRNRITPVFPYSETLAIGVERPTYWTTLLSKLTKFTVRETPYFDNESLGKLPKYHERSFTYSALPSVALLENHMLVGYFQSYLYFDDVKQKLFEVMGINEQREQIKHEFSDLLGITEKEKFPNVICIHFRLGDYKVKQDCHPILPYEYYDRALQMFSPEFLEKVRVLYFCEKEDVETVSNIMERLEDKYYLQDVVGVDTDIPDWKQLLIMSCGRINIIANSSFSWWSAYINDHPLKTVIYPSIWFGPSMGNMDVSDMFPKNDDWIRIYTLEDLKPHNF